MHNVRPYVYSRPWLTIESMKTFSPIWKSKYVSIETKYRIFKTRVSPIMLYNSHLWTSNNTLNGQINAFHRRMLRKMLNIKCPRIITNDELKRKIGYDEWTNVIDKVVLRHNPPPPPPPPPRQIPPDKIPPTKSPRQNPPDKIPPTFAISQPRSQGNISLQPSVNFPNFDLD